MTLQSLLPTTQSNDSIRQTQTHLSEILQRALSQKRKTPQDYVIDCITSHRTNEDTKHPSTRIGEIIYRVRRYRFNGEDDTFKPI